MSSFVFGDLLNGALLHSFSFGIPTSLSITLLIIATFFSQIPNTYFFCSFCNASAHSLKLKCSFFYENSIRFVLNSLKSSIFSAILSNPIQKIIMHTLFSQNLAHIFIETIFNKIIFNKITIVCQRNTS